MMVEIKTAAEPIALEVEGRGAARRTARETPLMQRVLQAFVDRAGAVSIEAVVKAFPAETPERVREALARLDDEDLLRLEGGRIDLAYPFSATATPFVVDFGEGAGQRFVCCAIDALGIAPMLGRPGAYLVVVPPLRRAHGSVGRSVGARTGRRRRDGVGRQAFRGRAAGLRLALNDPQLLPVGRAPESMARREPARLGSGHGDPGGIQAGGPHLRRASDQEELTRHREPGGDDGQEVRMTEYERAEEMVGGLTREEGILDYNPEQARLLLRVLRTLAHGRPVTGREIDAIAADLGWNVDATQAFLRPLTERDAHDAIIGVLPGLSLGDHPHRFSVNGQRMSTWCAQDTLHLPALLGQTATIESTSPLGRAPVRFTVGPDGVRSVNPPEAVLSIPIVDPGEATLETVEAIWMTFCRHIHFFATREEAAQWAAGRGDIAILTPDEGYRLGRQITSRLLAQAA